MPHLLRAVFVLIVIGLSLQPAHAQESAERDSSYGAGFFEIGTNVIRIGDLNDRLDGLGYPTFDRAMLALGGGGYGVVAGGLMLGGEGFGVLTGENAFEGRSVSLSGGYGLFNIGYLFRAAPYVGVYPMVGIGGGGLTLSIGSTDADSFDEVLLDPDREATLSKGGLLISLGGGVEYRIDVEDRGFLIGVRAGYLLSPFTSSWRLGGNVLGGPESSLGGPFIHLLIGGGG